uniref:Serine protease gd-like n=1 Tax=Diabrotica virgifera virgifera TaxID=50390 RepID=A0A6P7FVC9_DIAVI
MKYKYSLYFLLIWLPVILSRLPPNPCPDIFHYYKSPFGRIYGVVNLPYDDDTSLVFGVNASFVGNPKQTILKLERVTKVHELNDGTAEVVYNIFFPFNETIPKITLISYNDKFYCSGHKPIGTEIVNVRYIHKSNFIRHEKGFYKPETEQDISEDDIPVKSPIDIPTATQGIPKLIPDRVTTVTPQIPPPQNIPNKSPTVLDPPIFDKPDIVYIDIPDKVSSVPDPSQAAAEFNLDKVIDSIFAKREFESPSLNSYFKCGVASEEQPKNEIVSIDPRTSGSTDTKIGQCPWLVAFFWKRGPKYEYKCSATLISDKHVLTAARCVQYFKLQLVETEDIFLVMGTNDLENWNSNGAVTRKARRVDVHPFFMQNSKSAHGDIAIISMDSPIQFSHVLSPVCLWKGNTDLYPLVDKLGIVTGFEQDNDSAQVGLTYILKEKRAEMTIISQLDCFTSALGFLEVTSDKTFCTTSGETLTGPCTIGNTGAGLFVSMDGAYYLRGIASATPNKGGRCDLSSRYSVYCDVAKFLDWIKDHMT